MKRRGKQKTGEWSGALAFFARLFTGGLQGQ